MGDPESERQMSRVTTRKDRDVGKIRKEKERKAENSFPICKCEEGEGIAFSSCFACSS